MSLAQPPKEYNSRSSIFKYVRIRNIRLQEIDFSSNIPKPIYSQEPQPPQEDLTESLIGDSKESHIYFISREFQIAKELIRREFMDPKKKTTKDNWFFKNILQIKEKREEYYKTIEGMGINLPFFIFFECTYQDKEYLTLFSQEINNTSNKCQN